MAKRWTKEEVSFLEENYQEHGPRYCADKLGRPYGSVRSRASTIGISKAKKRWAQEEIDFLETNYRELGPEQCSTILGKSSDAIKTKAMRLGITDANCWSEEETKFLEENYEDKGPQYCADKLGRTTTAIHLKANRIGLSTTVRYSEQPTNVYYIYFEEHDLEKIGITNSLETRFRGLGSKPTIIKTKLFESGKDAFKKEQELLKLVENYKINTGALNNGNTETFRAPVDLQQQIIGLL